jgi:hypothetical protein
LGGRNQNSIEEIANANYILKAFTHTEFPEKTPIKSYQSQFGRKQKSDERAVARQRSN